MRQAILVLLLAAVLLSMAGCAPGPNQLAGTPDDDGKVAGFWLGLWHGIIAPITFIISLFSRNVSFYEVHNNGGWYNLGFVIGAGILFSGGFMGGRKRREE